MPVVARISSSSSSWGLLSSDCAVCSSRTFGQTICGSCFDRRIKQACRSRMGLPGMPRAVCVQPSSSSQPDVPPFPSAIPSISDPLRNEICEQPETRSSTVEDESLLGFLTKTSNPSEINQGKKSVKKSVRFSLAEENDENYSTTKSLGSASDPKTPNLPGVSSGSGSKKKVQFDETILESAADSKRPMQGDLLSSKAVMQHKCLRILSSKQGTPVPRSFGHGLELELDPSLRSRFLGSRCGTPKWAGESNHLQNYHELEGSDSEENQCLSCMPSPRFPQPAASTSYSLQAREMPCSVSGDSLWKRRQSCRPITGLQLEADESELLEAFDFHI